MAFSPAEIPIVAHLFPIVFFVIGLVVAVPQALLHFLTSPKEYIFTTAPLSDRVQKLYKRFFYSAWRVFSPLLDPGEAHIKKPLLRRSYGVVLEIGAGVGDNIKYYQRDLITRLILVEPNTNMHPALRDKAAAAGFTDADGSLLLLGCGGAATDEAALAAAGVGQGSVDTVVSIHVLCGIPGPAEAIEMYRRLLKPGGLLVFYEHVRSEQQSTVAWQTWYTEWLWRPVFDGCELNRPTGLWIANGPDGETGSAVASVGGARKRKGGGGQLANGADANRWKVIEIAAPEGQPTYTCIPHVKGYAIKP